MYNFNNISVAFSKCNNFHIGPLDEITYQIVSLIILKLATKVVLRCFWAEMYLFMGFYYDFIQFLRFSLIFINMKISRFTYLTTGRNTCV